jgi:hypothetical protein
LLHDELSAGGGALNTLTKANFSLPEIKITLDQTNHNVVTKGETIH